jgi:drug/metabolite transporter (DMT)-like permease
MLPSTTVRGFHSPSLIDEPPVRANGGAAAGDVELAVGGARMTTLVFLVVLAAAVLHASWNALVKHGGDPMFRLAVATLTGSVCAVPFLPFVSVPAAPAWPWLLGSVATHVGYYITLAWGYRTGDLSVVYPVARGVAPPLVALAALAVAGERLDPMGVAAVALICAGILALVLLGGAWRHRPGAVVSALGCGATIAAYTICDGQGVRAAGDPLGYIVWLHLIDGVFFAAAVLWARRARLARDVRRGLAPAALSGVLSMLAYGMVIWAMATTPMALVSALRETSVVLAAAIGTGLMGEPFGRRRVASALLVALGVVALRLA